MVLEQVPDWGARGWSHTRAGARLLVRGSAKGTYPIWDGARHGWGTR